MIGAIIGDIVGSRFEFSDAPTEGFDLFTPECSFTDDTVCTIAIADAILNEKPYKDTLHEWCRKYPNPKGGYGPKFQLWVESDDPQAYNSCGNGSAMRVSPIGWLFDEYQEVQEEAKKSAIFSHNHPEGIKGAECVATLIYWLRTCRVTRDRIETAVKRNFNYEFISIRDIYKIGSEGHFDSLCQETVPWAITCFLDSDNFEDAIRKAVLADGDTDTKANITGAISEAYYDIPDNIVKKACSYLPGEMLDIIEQFYNRIEERL